MIREVMKAEYEKVYDFIRQDNPRNYFVRLGFESEKPVYASIIGEFDTVNKLLAVLLRRNSGTLQFYAKGDFDADGFAKHIAELEFEALISPRSYCDRFLDRGLFSKIKEGAIIARLDRANMVKADADLRVEPLRIEDLDEVVGLYQEVFTAFSSKAVMEKRLRSGRGRGVCIRHEGRIASVVQSEFEEADSALIVGVATASALQGKGLATSCLKYLCAELQKEGKDLYLQYDNMDAGRIYERLGFTPIDQARHYIK